MTTVWKLLIGAGAIVIAAIVVLVISVELYRHNGPPAQERHAREVALKPLLESHANRKQVEQVLGLTFQDDSVGSSNRWGLEAWLSRESTNVYVRVREGVARYPGVFFHTTMDTMTWLFFDSEGRLQDYYVCGQ